MTQVYTEKFQHLEALVRQGSFRQVEQLLKQMRFNKISRAEALPIANFARRINQCRFALRVLNPIVNNESHPGIPPATVPEKIEYAESLRKLGATDEAREILESIDDRKHPSVLFHLAMSCFSQWRYVEAIAYLRLYISADLTSNYARLVGTLNLVAGLIRERHLEEASCLLAELKKSVEAGDHRLLAGHCLELSAQLSIHYKDFDQADRFLDEAEKNLSSASEVQKLWLYKWRAIAKSLQANRVTSELLGVCEQAKSAGHWETVRDASFYIAAIKREATLMNRVFFGTPFESYRNTILNETRDWFAPADEFILAHEGSSTTHLVDLANPLAADGRPLLDRGQLPHRLLILLARDFFKPLPMLAAFGQLFPGEHFNHLSSPGRIHHAVARLRKSLKHIHSEVRVTEKNGAYHLALLGSLGVRISRSPIPHDAEGSKLVILRHRFGTKEFSITEAKNLLGGSVSTVQRTLRAGVGANQLHCVYAGSKTRYRAT